jgi:hypothetical protein
MRASPARAGKGDALAQHGDPEGHTDRRPTAAGT